MTDKLTEALAWYRGNQDTGEFQSRYPDDHPVSVMAEAARRWASFPTDEDVERGARAGYDAAAKRIPSLPPWEMASDLNKESWRTWSRAALEAVKDDR